MSNGIPRYALYGESGTGSDLGPVHMQPLFSNIERQNWEIRPHRHSGLHQLIILQAGNIAAKLDDREIELRGPSVVSIPTNCVHGFGYSPEAVGHILTLKNDFMKSLLVDGFGSANSSWATRPRVWDLEPTEEASLKAIKAYLKIIEQELNARRLGELSALDAAVRLLLIAVQRMQNPDDGRDAVIMTNRNRILCRRFQELVFQNAHLHWTMDDYAERLATTSKQLSRVCHQVLGQAPLSFIHDVLNDEAKRKLSYTNSSVSEVCYDLGFKDPSYFSRFFRRLNGCSPRDFADAHR